MIRHAVGAIVYQHDKYLLVHKIKINTKTGKEKIQGEWDFIKGGVEKDDTDLTTAILRELEEETGSKEYEIVRQFNEKIYFNFPSHIASKIGYEKQETTMFLVEFLGDSLTPADDEISELLFVEKDEVPTKLTHSESREYFEQYIGG
ncbi:NUDIX domain-containing protein [Ornithinibacillus halophilus]|uniref:Putative (Di)nucleoside polyphosphate hydrolase n=1 Tax=Ornithinibacillus halophilus TaxID=930117 RepID=A0A1M5HQI0_9BACI|nr:NUDIX hydrolase [Ornithinibacillus halophilus]SHG18203.1 putative (di)nucleoside polyphosphate hydrolase [Ornithinibacillus halophilus]